MKQFDFLSKLAINSKRPTAAYSSGAYGTDQILRQRKKKAAIDKSGILDKELKLKQDSGVAHRLNRNMPAHTNFPENDFRMNT